jgi:predicted metal-dependent hydrolase
MQLALPLLATDERRQPASPKPRSGEGGCIFVRHRWARRYILRVLDDGTLRVTLPRRGSKREAEAFVERSASWIAHQRERMAQPVSPQSSAFVARGSGETGSFRRAKSELPQQLLALARAHNITVTRISVRNQRSRWGACSARGSITLNWRLILVPDFVREYVMIHELMHRRELNHSSRFWRHVAAACPDHDAARRWLRTEGQRLFRGGELC